MLRRNRCVLDSDAKHHGPSSSVACNQGRPLTITVFDPVLGRMVTITVPVPPVTE